MTDAEKAGFSEALALVESLGKTDEQSNRCVSSTVHDGHLDGYARATYGGPMYNLEVHNHVGPGSVLLKAGTSMSRYHVKHNVRDHFTGREDELQQIERAFFECHGVDRALRFVVFGVGGSGKTQLCLKFAEKYRERQEQTLYQSFV